MLLCGICGQKLRGMGVHPASVSSLDQFLRTERLISTLLGGRGRALNEGWADLSDTRNAPGMTLPANYTDDNVITQNGVRSLGPLWEGFYMKSLSVRSAEGWLFEEHLLS